MEGCSSPSPDLAQHMVGRDDIPHAIGEESFTTKRASCPSKTKRSESVSTRKVMRSKSDDAASKSLTNFDKDQQTSNVKLSYKDAKSKVQDFRSKANQKLKQHSYKAALEFYDAALDIYDNALPENQATLKEKVSLYCKMSETCLKTQPAHAKQALVYANSATELEPEYPKPYMCAAEALKALNRMEEAIDKYCLCFLQLKPQKDVHRLQAQVLHEAIMLALEHGHLEKLLILNETDRNEVGSRLVKLALEEELSSANRFRYLLFLFDANKSKPYSGFLAHATFEVGTFSLSSILVCADQKGFEIVFDTLVINGVNISIADIEEAICALNQKQVNILVQMFQQCTSDLNEAHFTHFAELAIERGKTAFLTLAIDNGAQPSVDKLMQMFTNCEMHHVDTCMQQYMLHALSGKKKSKFVMKMIRYDNALIDLSLALKLVMENGESYFAKHVIVSEAFTSPQQIVELHSEDDIDTVIEELATDADTILASDSQVNGFESKKGDFEGLAWEVECSQKVKQFLNESRYSCKFREAVISKIHNVASGERSKSLSKPVADDLYEAKLTKSARIIWEEPIQFSPRLTQNVANPVYSEVIRIWDVILNHDTLYHTVQNVLASRERSAKANLKLRLVESTVDKHNRKIKLPRQFHVVAGKLRSADVKIEECCVSVPSPNKDEYVLVPFYQVSSAYIDSVLSSDNDRRDLPFKGSHEEHQIISLPDVQEATLLLGRSGTGKTTCCVYRMWNQFRQYWEQALLNTASDEMSHLHQVFVTKNDALCDRIKRLFYNMTASYRYLSKHLSYESCKLPKMLQTVHDLAYPMFLTSKEFFVILDASLGNPFFPRNADNSLAVRLITDGQPYEQKNLAAIQRLFNFSERPSEADPLMPQEHQAISIEVTASYFSTKLWPRICPEKKLDPILVWMEIKSFIKGSHEALQCERGFLSQEQYEEVGKKKAPNFEGNRREIYSLFEKYQKILGRNTSLFDECDFIRSLYVRLTSMNEPPKWHLDYFFVDEVQDFTESELAVFIQCCREPNGLFFTGDTAQSIMRGVAFRFSDLTSLFYYARNKRLPFQHDVAVPSQIHKLTVNFRSHSNILDLACSVIDLMSRFFPLSFDTLPSDSGLFSGPMPVLINSCGQEDLMQLLMRNRRGASPSLLGAHQVIIVRDEKAKEKLPEGLKDEIVLTVFESKGLEFDDVLLYNFFSDSMSKEGRNSWHVVTAYADEKWKNEGSTRLSSAGQTRPLKFDESQDKSLLSELKHLYTAITRAKCNFWVYDSDESKRLPVFDYWNRRKLVKIVNVTESAPEDEIIFQTTSTSDQWERQGDYYKEHGRFEQAALCYKKADATVKQFEVEAYSNTMKASYSDLSQDKVLWLKRAAQQFLLCDLMEHSTDHLINAHKCLQKIGHKEAALLHARLAKGGCFGDERR